MNQAYQLIISFMSRKILSVKKDDSHWLWQLNFYRYLPNWTSQNGERFSE